MKRYTVDLKAGEETVFSIRGKTFTLLSNSSDIKCKFVGSGVETFISKGNNLEINEFDSIRILSTVNQQIKFFAGYGKMSDNWMSGDVTTTPASSDLNYSSKISLIVGDGVKLLRITNTKRKSITIKPNGGDILIGNVTGQNFSLKNGESITLECNSAIYVSTSSISTIDVEYLEEAYS